MIPYQDQIKINDFRYVFKKVLNPNEDKEINDVIDELFYNIECEYEEYRTEFEFIPATSEVYKYHILQPVNGMYSLIDFLINRAITNIDQIIINSEKNQYDHRKIVSINRDRYESNRGEYSSEFIDKQNKKSRLHETGHAMHMWDTTQDNAIHTIFPGGLKEKVRKFEQILGTKYPNLLHSSQIQHIPEVSHNMVNNNKPFGDEILDEVITEYKATKHSGLYDDYSNYGSVAISTKPSIFVTSVPNKFNNYAFGARLMYHLENLVSKSSMFNSIYFESDAAIREFAEKYAEIINAVWHDNASVLPRLNSSFERMQYLMKQACNYKIKEDDEKGQSIVVLANKLIESIFAKAYYQEYNGGNISSDRMFEIARRSSKFSMLYYSDTKGYEISSTRKWYDDMLIYLQKNKLNPNPTGR